MEERERQHAKKKRACLDFDEDIGAAALESISGDINKIIFGTEEDSEDEDIKPVNIDNMSA